jgi:hypothetical protein
VILNPEEKLIYERQMEVVIVPKQALRSLQGVHYLGSSTYAFAIDALTHDIDFAVLYANLASQTVAVRIRIIGDVSPSEIDPDFEIKQPLARDANYQKIKFPYIMNKHLFQPVEESTVFTDLNFKKNSCLASLIIDTFRPSCLKYGFDLNYESLWDICCPDRPYPEDDEYRLSLVDAKVFFRLYRLKLVAIDIFMRVLMLYEPEQDGRSENSQYSPYIMRVLVHQGHAYALNHNLRSFDSKVKRLWTEDRERLVPSARYFIRNDEDCSVKILDSYEGIREFIESYQGEEKYVKILTPCLMDSLMICLQKDFGVTGSNLEMRKKVVRGFQVEQGGTVFLIRNYETPSCSQPDIPVENEAEYSIYMEAFKKVYHGLLCKGNMSHYHPQFFEVMNYYARCPLMGYFSQYKSYCDKKGRNVDMNKAYTARMMQLQYLPVGDPFCIFRPFKGKHIYDYGIYLVRKKGEVSTRDLIIFDKTHVLLSGVTLRKLGERGVTCRILYEWKPIRLAPNPMRELVTELWKNKGLSMDQKKSILNICFGCLDKKWNRRARAEFFDERGEAWAKKRALPNVEVINMEMPREDKASGMDLDFGLPFDAKVHEEEDPMECGELYLIVSRAQKALEEGFLPISSMISRGMKCGICMEYWKMLGSRLQGSTRTVYLLLTPSGAS